MSQEDRERRHIIDYFLAETSDKGVTVERAEKITSERIYGHKHDVWDVQASDGRWWVITNPTNLFSAEEYPSMHVAFALHIGVMARMMAHQTLKAPVNDEERKPLEPAWRRYEQAVEALDHADEAEDFQAVGMRCRECLVTFIATVANDDMVPKGVEPPKKADFVHWSEYIAGTWARGSSGAESRGYLKTTSKAAWTFVNWLTHAKNAHGWDARMALDATSHVLEAFGTALLRYDQGAPERCPNCGSYQLSDDYDEEARVSFRVCGRCDWHGEQQPW